MRKLFPLLALAVFAAAPAAVRADGEKTIKGDAVCAKCALKEASECQNVVLVTEDGKTVTYWLEGPASKAAHGKLGICSAKKDAPVKVKVTGKCEKKDDKLVITVDTIDKAS